VELRRARLEDAAAIAEVQVRSWQAAYEHVFGAERLAAMDAGPRLAMWERALSREHDTFVAEQDGRVVAFVAVGASQDDDAEGQLFTIYALPDAWGSGVGRRLMSAGVDALRVSGYRDAVLYVIEDNPRARRFYEREGWALDGVRKEEEWEGLTIAELRYRRRL
jgi:ribosomal protein S18 acetylase RimI-like enzyme